MDEIIVSLIVIFAVAVVCLGIIVFFNRKQNDKMRQIIDFAARRGWAFEKIRGPLEWGFRLQSSEWTIESLSRSDSREAGPGSSNIANSTTFSTKIPGSTFIIGPRTSHAELGLIGDTLAQQVLKIAMGPDAQDLTELQAGSGPFNQKYMVWAKDHTEVMSRVLPAVEYPLLTWKGSPLLIKCNSQDLSIELRDKRINSVDEINSLINIGERISSLYK